MSRTVSLLLMVELQEKFWNSLEHKYNFICRKCSISFPDRVTLQTHKVFHLRLLNKSYMSLISSPWLDDTGDGIAEDEAILVPPKDQIQGVLQAILHSQNKLENFGHIGNSITHPLQSVPAHSQIHAKSKTSLNGYKIPKISKKVESVSVPVDPTYVQQVEYLCRHHHETQNAIKTSTRDESEMCTFTADMESINEGESEKCQNVAVGDTFYNHLKDREPAAANYYMDSTSGSETSLVEIVENTNSNDFKEPSENLLLYVVSPQDIRASVFGNVGRQEDFLVRMCDNDIVNQQTEQQSSSETGNVSGEEEGDNFDFVILDKEEVEIVDIEECNFIQVVEVQNEHLTREGDFLGHYSGSFIDQDPYYRGYRRGSIDEHDLDLGAVETVGGREKRNSTSSEIFISNKPTAIVKKNSLNAANNLFKSVLDKTLLICIQKCDDHPLMPKTMARVQESKSALNWTMTKSFTNNTNNTYSQEPVKKRSYVKRKNKQLEPESFKWDIVKPTEPLDIAQKPLKLKIKRRRTEESENLEFDLSENKDPDSQNFAKTDFLNEKDFNPKVDNQKRSDKSLSVPLDENISLPETVVGSSEINTSSDIDIDRNCLEKSKNNKEYCVTRSDYSVESHAHLNESGYSSNLSSESESPVVEKIQASRTESTSVQKTSKSDTNSQIQDSFETLPTNFTNYIQSQTDRIRGILDAVKCSSDMTETKVIIAHQSQNVVLDNEQSVSDYIHKYTASVKPVKYRNKALGKNETSRKTQSKVKLSNGKTINVKNTEINSTKEQNEAKVIECIDLDDGYVFECEPGFENPGPVVDIKPAISNAFQGFLAKIPNSLLSTASKFFKKSEKPKPITKPQLFSKLGDSQRLLSWKKPLEHLEPEKHVVEPTENSLPEETQQNDVVSTDPIPLTTSIVDDSTTTNSTTSSVSANDDDSNNKTHESKNTTDIPKDKLEAEKKNDIESNKDLDNVQHLNDGASESNNNNTINKNSIETISNAKTQSETDLEQEQSKSLNKEAEESNDAGDNNEEIDSENFKKLESIPKKQLDVPLIEKKVEPTIEKTENELEMNKVVVNDVSHKVSNKKGETTNEKSVDAQNPSALILLQNHNEIDYALLQYSCTVCTFRFDNARQLRHHEKTHTIQKMKYLQDEFINSDIPCLDEIEESLPLRPKRKRPNLINKPGPLCKKLKTSVQDSVIPAQLLESPNVTLNKVTDESLSIKDAVKSPPKVSETEMNDKLFTSEEDINLDSGELSQPTKILSLPKAKKFNIPKLNGKPTYFEGYCQICGLQCEFKSAKTFYLNNNKCKPMSCLTCGGVFSESEWLAHDRVCFQTEEIEIGEHRVNLSDESTVIKPLIGLERKRTFICSACYDVMSNSCP